MERVRVLPTVYQGGCVKLRKPIIQNRSHDRGADPTHIPAGQIYNSSTDTYLNQDGREILILLRHQYEV